MFVKEEAGICIWFDDESQSTGAVFSVNDNTQYNEQLVFHNCPPDVFYMGFKNWQEMSVVANMFRKKYYKNGDPMGLTEMESGSLERWINKLIIKYPAQEQKRERVMHHANSVCQGIMDAFPPVPPESILQIQVPKSWIDHKYAAKLREKGIPCVSVEQFREFAWSLWGDRRISGRPVSMMPKEPKQGDTRCTLDIILDEIIEKYAPKI